MAQAAPGVPQAAPGLAPPGLSVPGGIPAVAGGPGATGGPAALGDPLQLATGANQPAAAAPSVALGEQASALPFILAHPGQAATVTSGATLLGASGGSLTTFFSTKPFFNAGETVQTKLQHEALVRDASFNFVKSLDTVQGAISSSPNLELSAGLDEVLSSNQALKYLFEQVQAGAPATTAAQALGLLSGAAESTPPTLDQIASATLGAAAAAAPEISEFNNLMTEIKFVMPGDVLQKAQYAAVATLFAAHSSEAGTPTSHWSQASSAAISDFVDAVRSDFGLEPITLS